MEISFNLVFLWIQPGGNSSPGLCTWPAPSLGIVVKCTNVHHHQLRCRHSCGPACFRQSFSMIFLASCGWQDTVKNHVFCCCAVTVVLSWKAPYAALNFHEQWFCISRASKSLGVFMFSSTMDTILTIHFLETVNITSQPITGKCGLDAKPHTPASDGVTMGWVWGKAKSKLISKVQI